MKLNHSKLTAAGAVALAACLSFGLVQSPLALGQEPAKEAPKAKGVNQPPDPRVQQRTYRFADTNEDLPYAVFVSSKVSKDKKNPLIIALHGLGGTHNSLLRGNALDLAEEGGYILVGPMGYNPRGWYGVPAGQPRGGKGGDGKGKAPKADPAAANDPPNLRQLSEKDVMNVLDMIRKEFNVDERRTYLMGHSMGGAGALYLGTKYASNWAAVAAIAPAAFSMQANARAMLAPVKDTLPVIVTQGDADTLVTPAGTRAWIEAMKELKMDHKYVEVAGAGHGDIISIGMPDIFAFFREHTKPAGR
jgi:pimeloyl-ACP methyl ester carboxylesterase